MRSVHCFCDKELSVKGGSVGGGRVVRSLVDDSQVSSQLIGTPNHKVGHWWARSSSRNLRREVLVHAGWVWSMTCW